MNIGTLDFEVLMKYDSVSQATSEMQQSIKDFSISAQKGGEDVGNAMANAAHRIDDAWGVLNVATQKNKILLESCEATYKGLGEAAAESARKGTEEGARECDMITRRQSVLSGVISKLKEQNTVLDEQRTRLNGAQGEYNKLADEVQKNNDRTTSFRMQLRKLTQEMAMQEAQARQTGGESAVYALRATDAFKQMQLQAARLTDAMADAQAQARILSHDNAGLQGVISAASGVAGAFSAAQGAVGLFSDENEELQKIMVKVQSVMAVTMGLQQVANTLNKDSAASLTIFNKVREAYAETYSKLSKKIEDEVIMQLEAKQAAEEATEAGKKIAQYVKEQADATELATEAQEKATEAITEAIHENVSAQENQNATEKAGAAATGLNTVATEEQTAAENANTLSKNKNAAAEGVDTAQTHKNTVAKGANAIAAKLLTKATIGLAAGLRAVGAALKAILPLAIIGGIIAGIAAAFSALTKKSREAKKEQEEFYKAVAEGAAEPVAKFENLSTKWNDLGNDMKAKQKFVEENRAAFTELGIEVNNVADAEKALKEGKDAFVAAQIAKAKAMAATQKAAEYYKQALEASLAMENAEYGSKDYDDNLEKMREAQGKANKLIEQSIAEEEEAAKKLDEAGINAAGKIKEGSIAAFEKLIEEKRAKLKQIADPKEYAAAMKEINKAQKQIDRITGAKSTSGTGKDPFKEKLDKQKKQYQEYAKWRNSTDVILQQAAATQFQTLLQQGSNYLDYLRRQRDKLMSEMTGGRGSKKQREQLATLNNAIAEETKSTVLEQFDQELQRQLSGANSLLEKLAIIERKRKELANDGTELDNEQRQMLDKQREQITQEMESQYRAAQQEYYDYLESRLTAFEQYQQKMAELQEKLDKEADPLQRAMIVKQMGILQQQQYTRDAQAADELVKQYRTAEEKMTDIKAEYEEKRRVLINRGGELEVEMREAIAAGDEARIEQIKKEQEAIERALKGIEKDLSKSLTEFLGEEIVGKMLDDAGTLTVEKIDEIIAAVEKKKAELPVDVDPKKFEELLEKLKKLKKETREQQATIKSIISELQKGDIGEALKQTMVIAEKYGSTVVETYSEVVNLLKQMGAAGDEISQQILSDIGEVAGSAAQLAVDIATQNWGNAVVSGVKLIAGAVKLWNDANRENADAIKESEEKINELENSIKNLRNTLKRTYDSGRYDLQKEIIDKLREEIAEEKKKLEAIRKDIDGSSSDYTEDDYNAQRSHIEDIEEQIAQAYEALAEDLTQTTIPDIESEITDALINAFANGYSNADIDKEIAKIANKLMKNAAIEMLKTQYLADAVAEWYKAFENAMADGMLDEQEKSNLQADFANATAAFRSQLEALNEMFPDEEDVSGTLSGALKGASQESIDLLAGYTNATRIIEQSQLDIMTRQLSHIASIDARLEQAVTILAAMSRRTGLVTETVTAADSNNTNERAYGIIND